MPVGSIACDVCGKRFRLKPEYAGRRLRCPFCGESISAAPPSEITEDDLNGLRVGEITERPAAAHPSRAAATATDWAAQTTSGSKPSRPFLRPMSEWTALDRIVFRTGVGCVVFGVVGLLLPHFGLQFRKLGHLAPAAQSVASWGVIFCGGTLIAYVAALRGRMLRAALWTAVSAIVLVAATMAWAFIVAGGSSPAIHPQRQFTPPGVPAAPPPHRPAHFAPAPPVPPAPLTYEKLVERFGASRIVRVRFEKTGERDLGPAIREKVKTLVDAGASPSWRYTSNGGEHNLILAPVSDLDRFAAQLGMGSVTSVDAAERRITIDASGD